MLLPGPLMVSAFFVPMHSLLAAQGIDRASTGPPLTTRVTATAPTIHAAFIRPSACPIVYLPQPRHRRIVPAPWLCGGGRRHASLSLGALWGCQPRNSGP